MRSRWFFALAAMVVSIACSEDACAGWRLIHTGTLVQEDWDDDFSLLPPGGGQARVHAAASGPVAFAEFCFCSRVDHATAVVDRPDGLAALSGYAKTIVTVGNQEFKTAVSVNETVTSDTGDVSVTGPGGVGFVPSGFGNAAVSAQPAGEFQKKKGDVCNEPTFDLMMYTKIVVKVQADGGLGGSARAWCDAQWENEMVFKNLGSIANCVELGVQCSCP